MTDLPPELQQLEARMAKIQLFAIAMRATNKFQSPETAQGAALLAKHLRYVFDLADQNRLLAAGPLDRDVPGPVDGIAIIRADSREQAEAIATNEPLHKARWRINSVRSWELNMGALAYRHRRREGRRDAVAGRLLRRACNCRDDRPIIVAGITRSAQD
jgi:uncharacterized protein YciI